MSAWIWRFQRYKFGLLEKLGSVDIWDFKSVTESWSFAVVLPHAVNGSNIYRVYMYWSDVIFDTTFSISCGLFWYKFRHWNLFKLRNIRENGVLFIRRRNRFYLHEAMSFEQYTWKPSTTQQTQQTQPTRITSILYRLLALTTGHNLVFKASTIMI